MGIMGGKKEAEPVAQPAMTMAPPQRRQMHISEQAAIAAQHVLNLESENEQLRQQYGVALNRIALLEMHVQDMKRSMIEIGQERDDYKHHYSYIWGALQNAGAIIVECMRVPPRAVAQENGGEVSNERIKGAVDKLEKELVAEPAPANADQK